MFILQFAILIYSVILHEIAHGWVADKLGDPTARISGRLTLDPRPHIDPLMTIALPLLLVITGAGVIFGSAKPVPIDSFNFREPKKDMAITALAGPLTNLGIAVILALILKVLYFFVINESVYAIIRETLLTGMMWNVGLAVFNLFPLPPLDGFKVLAGILPDEMAAEMYRWERFGFTIIFLVLFLMPGLIFGFVSPITHLITGFLLSGS